MNKFILILIVLAVVAVGAYFMIANNGGVDNSGGALQPPALPE